MASARDIRLLRLGLDFLRITGLEKIARANRDMTEPLVEAIRTVGISGNDQADLRALRDQLPALFERMDDTPIADWAEPLLLQTFALSRIAAIPADIEELERDETAATESLQETLRAT